MVKNRKDLTPRRRSQLGRTIRTSDKFKSCPTKANVRVVVRVRPQSNTEHNNYLSSVIQVTGEQTLIFDPKDECTPFYYHGVQQKGRDLLKRPHKHLTFNFDRIFGEHSHNDEVFELSTKQLITRLMDGSNCSVFVYGATGAGKTFTMIGKPEMPGITILTMHELFNQKCNLELERDFDLAVSYLEVYNENVKDLLKPGAPLPLREDIKMGVIVAGLTIKRIDNPDELFNLLDKGNKCRTQHPTEANSESSRSHAVFQVYISMKYKSTGQTRFAKLSMIDLAGSERGSVTGCKGARFEEGANINRSLLALGNCINSLADGKKHIPYRDSKLTRLLKDSLGGNCHTVMIANVSPTYSSLEDTYNTLKYALRAKKIKTNVKKNVVKIKMSAEQYLKIIEDLEKENELLKAQNKCKCKITEEKNIRVATVTSANASETVMLTTPSVTSAIANETVILITNPSETLAVANETVVLTNPSVTSSETTPATVSKMVFEDNIEMTVKVNKLFEEYTNCQERMLRLKLNRNLNSVRINIKQETNNRLSGFCVEDVDKEKGHKRLEQTVSRLNRQSCAYELDIEVLDRKLKTLQMDIDNLVNLVPSLKDLVAKQYLVFEKIKAESEVEEYKVVCKFIENELQIRGCIMEKMANKMKPWFSLLHSQGLTTEDMVHDYRSIFNDIQGVCKVTFDTIESEDVNLNSSVSPRSSVQRYTQKRKLAENLDSTFVYCRSPVANLMSGSENVLTKVCTPTLRRPVQSAVQRVLKVKNENKPINNNLNKKIGTMGTSSRFNFKKTKVDEVLTKHSYLARNRTNSKN